MSGERILLQGGPTGEIEALVRAAALVVKHAGVRTALIGGLAVSCRLATAHRATGDVDVVADEPPPIVAASASATENLINAGIAKRSDTDPGRPLFIGPTKIEIIDTTAVDARAAAEVEPDLNRLFVLAHRWALDSATDCTIGVSSTDIEVTVPVAGTASLVAMKLHAIQDRSDDRKRASDAWDLFRLLDSHNAKGAVVAAFDVAPPDLFRLVGDALDRVFRFEVTRTRLWLQGLGEPVWAAIATEQAMTDLAEEFVRRAP